MKLASDESGLLEALQPFRNKRLCWNLHEDTVNHHAMTAAVDYSLLHHRSPGIGSDINAP